MENETLTTATDTNNILTVQDTTAQDNPPALIKESGK